MSSPPPESYMAGVRLVSKLVAEWALTHAEPPRFRFPPFPLLASLGDIGERLALDDGARELVALICKRARERLGEFPTVLMLQATLDTVGVAYETAALSDFGLNVGTA